MFPRDPGPMPPSVVHVWVVHAPIVLLPTAAALFVAAACGAGRAIRVAALALVVVAVGGTVVAYLTGGGTAAMRLTVDDARAGRRPAAEAVRATFVASDAPALDVSGSGPTLSDRVASHAVAGKIALTVVLVGGLVAVAATLRALDRVRAGGWTDVVAALAVLAAGLTLAWAGHLGGAIRHEQVREVFVGVLPAP